MDDLISRRAVYEMLNDLGGCGASDDWTKGWDEAINGAIKNLENIPATYDPEEVAARIEKAGMKMSTAKPPHTYMRAVGTRTAIEIVRDGRRRKSHES